MEGELAFRSDRWMKGSEWSWFWYSFQYKVYNGPAYSNHKNGERKEKGDIVNGAKSGLWSGKIKYEGEYKNGKQIETWKYYNKRGKMTTEEVYYTCDEDCSKRPITDCCRNEGKVKKSKDFK
jgi:hypothetical protein